MTTFRAKSNIVLGFLFALALLAFIAVEKSKKDVRQQWYDEKLEAAILSRNAADYLKSFRLEEGVFVDMINDPNQTTLVGQEYSLITTDRGYIDAKLTSLNPNFAAVIVQYLMDAGVKSGDVVAVAVTGSFPALNISVLAAIETLKLKPIIISSVGASNYGANDPYFTWLEMENALYSAHIFSNKSIAASIGGGFDIGRGLSPEGRQLIIDAIERNNILFINENHLEKSIDKRMELYAQQSQGKPIKGFINVGGGISSLGHTVNSELIPTGLTKNLLMKNYPVKGVIVLMGQKGVPIIHLANIKDITRAYDLPNSPVPLPEPGEGGIFVQKKYDLVITSIATAILIVVILLVFINEKKSHRLGAEIVNAQQPIPESDDRYEDELL
ncbi:MAG TPA: poly-gamma-glutamate system protein [Tenuifilaceae bacterium]|nr:poly-gamma-glutamate system protein [Tenuifilaceae bacterium]